MTTKNPHQPGESAAAERPSGTDRQPTTAAERVRGPHCFTAQHHQDIWWARVQLVTLSAVLNDRLKRDANAVMSCAWVESEIDRISRILLDVLNATTPHERPYQ